MEKYNNLKVDNKKNINPEFFNLFAQELERIDEKEEERKRNKEIKKVNKEVNTNENIVIFISKREVRIVRKLLNLVDNLIVNSNKK